MRSLDGGGEYEGKGRKKGREKKGSSRPWREESQSSSSSSVIVVVVVHIRRIVSVHITSTTLISPHPPPTNKQLTVHPTLTYPTNSTPFLSPSSPLPLLHPPRSSSPTLSLFPPEIL